MDRPYLQNLKRLTDNKPVISIVKSKLADHILSEGITFRLISSGAKPFHAPIVVFPLANVSEVESIPSLSTLKDSHPELDLTMIIDKCIRLGVTHQHNTDFGFFVRLGARQLFAFAHRELIYIAHLGVARSFPDRLPRPNTGVNQIESKSMLEKHCDTICNSLYDAIERDVNKGGKLAPYDFVGGLNQFVHTFLKRCSAFIELKKNQRNELSEIRKKIRDLQAKEKEIISQFSSEAKNLVSLRINSLQEDDSYNQEHIRVLKQDLDRVNKWDCIDPDSY